MGDFAEDLINDFSQEFPDAPVNIMVPIEIDYSVSVVHRRTGHIEWTGTVKASSKRDAQTQFRKQHADVRARYTHEYGLLISHH